MSVERDILRAFRALPNDRGSLADIAPIVGLRSAHLVAFVKHLVELERVRILERPKRGNPFTSETTKYQTTERGIARIDELERREFQRSMS